MAEAKTPTAKTTDGTPTGPDADTSGQPPAGAKIEQANAAERESVVKTVPAEVAQEGAVLVNIDDADGLEAVLSAATSEEYVTLDADVVESFVYPRTKRPVNRILFHKGQVVRRADIDARRSVIDTRAVDGLAGYIDPSTLASGSYSATAGS